LTLDLAFPVFIVFMLAAWLKGATGLGFSTLALPLLAWFFEPVLVIAVVLMPSLFSNLVVMWQAGSWREVVRRFWPLYLATLPGLLLGFYLLIHVEADWSRRVLGTVLVGYCLWSLVAPAWRCPSRWAPPLAWPAGFLTGLVSGLTGSQVMPVLPYLMALPLPREVLVQAVNLSFTLSSLVMLALFGGAGRFDADILSVSVLGLIPVALGVWAGGRLRRRLPETTFRRLVLAVLLALGLGLLLRSAGPG
jgi:uncharacterized protein